uniref:Galectin n=1 Tax=Panagrolaimus davidi TaxID=227884 RepID=A0A914P6F3_9BILA
MDSTKIEIPVFMRWKVSKNEIQKRLQKCSSTAKAVNLKELPGIKYGIVILKTKENEIQVGLAFRMPKNPTIINAKFKLSVIPAYNFDGSIYEKVFKEDGDAWGNPVCSWKEFFDPANNYFINDYIYITLEGIFSFEKEQFCIGFEIKGSNDLKTFYNRDDKNFEISGSDGKCVKVSFILLK